MKIHNLLVLLFCDYALCSIVNNVRLVDHFSYVRKVISRTMNIVEERCWCNLKLPDYTQRIDESILLSPFRVTVDFTNGFVPSIQRVDIRQDTVSQVWHYNGSAEVTHIVTVRGALRMLDVAVGYDVIGHLEGNNQAKHYTVVYTHPLVTYMFSVIMDLLTGDLTVTVVGDVPRTTLVPQFRPRDEISDIFVSTFNATATSAAGMLAWGTEVFQSIAHQLVTEEIPFPEFCYNCNN